MADTDIKLTVGLETQDAEKTAEQLQKEIKDIFQSRQGEQSASLTNLEIQMKKNYDAAEALREKMSQLSNEEPMPTTEFSKIDAELDELNAKYEELGRKRAELEESGLMHPRMIKSIDEEMEVLEKRMIPLEKERERLMSAGLDRIPINETDAYKKLEAQLDLVNDKLKQQIVRYNELVISQQNAVGSQINEYASVNRSIMGLSSTLRGLGRLIPGVSTKGIMAVSMLTRGVNRLTNLTKKDLTGALNGIKGTFGKLGSLIAAHPIATAVIGVVGAVALLASKLKKAFDELKEKVKETIISLGKLSVQLLKTGAQLAGLLAKGALNIGTIVARKSIKAIQSIINKLNSLKGTITENIKLMATWNDGNNDVNRSMSNITSSLAYLKASLTTAIVPLLNMVEPILTRIVDKLAEMVTYIGMAIAKLTGASTFQKAIKQQKDYAESLAKTNGQLASFDKLNNINTDKGEAVDFGLVNLEETPLPDWLNDLEKLGEKISMTVTNMLNKIPWNDVKKKAKEAAISITDFINGFVGVEGIADAVGKTLGESINTITTFINNFVTNLDGKKLGEQISIALDTMINTVNWKKLGKMFSKSINATFEIVKTIAKKFDGKKLGKRISTALRTALTDINWNTIQKAVNGIAEDLAGLLNGVITPENFALITASFANVLNTIFTGVRLFTTTAEWKKWGDSIALSINNFFATFDFEAAAETLSNLANGLLDMLLSAVSQIEWEQVKDKFVEFISNIQWEDIANNAVEISHHLMAGLNAIWAALKDSDAFDQILDLVAAFLSEKKNWEKAFKKITNKVAIEVIKAKIRYWWKNSVAPWFTAKKWKELGETAFPGLTSSFDGLKKKLKAKWEEIRKTLKASFSGTSTTLTSIWNKMTNKLGKIWAGLKNILQAPLNATIDVINALLKRMTDGLNNMIYDLNQLSFDVPDWVPLIGGETFGLNITPLVAKQIPHLAQGTVIPPNMSNFLAMLGDNNKETEVVSPLSTIEQALRNVLSEQNINVTFEVKGDPSKIFSVVQKEAKSYNKRTGSYAFR